MSARPHTPTTAGDVATVAWARWVDGTDAAAEQLDTLADALQDMGELHPNPAAVSAALVLVDTIRSNLSAADDGAYDAVQALQAVIDGGTAADIGASYQGGVFPFTLDERRRALRVAADVLEARFPTHQAQCMVPQGLNQLYAHAVWDWPGVIRVTMRHSGELIAQSAPGQPDVLAPAPARAQALKASRPQ